MDKNITVSPFLIFDCMRFGNYGQMGRAVGNTSIRLLKCMGFEGPPMTSTTKELPKVDLFEMFAGGECKNEIVELLEYPTCGTELVPYFDFESSYNKQRDPKGLRKIKKQWKIETFRMLRKILQRTVSKHPLLNKKCTIKKKKEFALQHESKIHETKMNEERRKIENEDENENERLISELIAPTRNTRKQNRYKRKRFNPPRRYELEHKKIRKTRNSSSDDDDDDDTDEDRDENESESSYDNYHNIDINISSNTNANNNNNNNDVADLSFHSDHQSQSTLQGQHALGRFYTCSDKELLIVAKLFRNNSQKKYIYMYMYTYIYILSLK
ncbi:hypothetical protein RFI_12206 [Reticulomyxa filosa]|uniref:Uncharacterized protein n=1 Tax=Reticulomyxa filosa TaxID=46433 RepID=X6NGW1_RETFI|nr:hypothetical protein RFI_12206 [Reticulomyxa filosa]|eukprot:ETO24944.1 hypothetical protein RFI_12206 [Reticulomyxa filosa]